MKFTQIDKLKALSIVHIFETSKAFGDHGAVAVLDDGAGVSYGINQFTHRSGALNYVVGKYLRTGAPVGREVLLRRLPLLALRTSSAIDDLARDAAFKKALAAAAITAEMRAAQHDAAVELYLTPAIGACEALGFQRPLSLAVIYDSMTHGSWRRIRDQVDLGNVIRASRSRDDTERSWITEYVRRRHTWLTGNPRLNKTAYRTRFFLNEIALGRWDLELPLTVHGVRLTTDMFRDAATWAEHADAALPQHDSTAGPGDDSAESTVFLPNSHHASTPQNEPAGPSNQDAEQGCLDAAESAVNRAVEKYDRVDAMVRTVIRRSDAAKSLWAAVAGTLWQTAWAVIGFAAGMPREVWLVAAVCGAAFGLFYLYRQIELGKLRERASLSAGPIHRN